MLCLRRTAGNRIPILLSMQDVRTQTRIFISYSRKDLEVAQNLRDRLVENGFDAYLDIHDIIKGEPWRERLRGLIERADTVLFLISPDSVASEICEWEINEAELDEKRLFPVVVRDTPTGDIPQRLQRLNFTSLDHPDKWASEFPLLLSAMNEDVVWVREHTRLGEMAARWERAGRPNRALLRGADLTGAEQWRDSHPVNAPQLSKLHADFLRRSREVSQQRLRAWLIGTFALAGFAIGLSMFAYRQRDLAVQNGNTAERRAAALATDVAINRADQGALNESLLMLLDASTRYAPQPVPEKLLLAMRDVTKQASRSRTFWFSVQARAFHLADTIIVTDPSAGVIVRIDPSTGERRDIAHYGGYDIVDLVDAAGDLVFLASDQNLYTVDLATKTAAATEPVRLASLHVAGETPVDWFTPTLHASGASGVVGQRVFERGGTSRVGTVLWRFDVADGALKQFDVEHDAGRLLRASDRAAYLWNAHKQRMHALSFDSGKLSVLTARQAVRQGISPCEEQTGNPPAEHLQAVFATIKPGHEGVRCAGLYGPLALMSQERAFARWMRDEYFLFPAGPTAAEARKDFWLHNAVERLGALGSEQPFAWNTGSAEGALVAVSHADKILLLGLDNGRYLTSALDSDSDLVAREIATPEITDGGRFYRADHLAYSGPDGNRYRVTVLAIGREKADSPWAAQSPKRAYWGSCGVQRSVQGKADGVIERPFSVERQKGGGYHVQFGERSVVVPIDDVRCASVSAHSLQLAIVDEAGVAVFDIGDEDAAPVLLARIDDPTIDTVSFLGAEQQTLLTAHQYKVTAWRLSGDGQYAGETVFRSTRSTLFAEGAPDGERMLIWLALATAEATIEVVPVPHADRIWLEDGPFMLVSQPDYFFGQDGAVYTRSGHEAARLMPAVALDQLAADAVSALSPSCRPPDGEGYRASPCWQASF